LSSDAPELTEGFWQHFIDQPWLDQRQEVALDPELPIVDPHHHLWAPPRPQYEAPELLADLGAGHNVVATVYLETLAYYRASGPDELKPVGETEHVAAVAEAVARQGNVPRVAAGIIGQADLARGAAVQAVLEAHVEAGRGRFRGVRANLFHDGEVAFGYPGPPPGLSRDNGFREGFGRLAPLGLVCDVMAFHTNQGEVAELAAAFPDTTLIINHLGAPIGRRPYADRPDEVFALWRDNIALLAARPNVLMKIGGLGGPFFGVLLPHRLREREVPIGSEELAALYRPWFEVAVEAFGPERCMFESNFPADKYDCSYEVLWNAFKRLAAGFSDGERAALFSGTANRAYRLGLPGL